MLKIYLSFIHSVCTVLYLHSFIFDGKLKCFTYMEYILFVVAFLAVNIDFLVSLNYFLFPKTPKLWPLFECAP